MTQKRIGFFGVRATQERHSADNTGNRIHAHAARAFFDDIEEVSPTTDPDALAALRERCSHLAWVTATTLYVRKNAPAQHHANEAAFVEAAQLPVVPFGVGCDAGLDDTVNGATLEPATIRLLQVISEHAGAVAARGEFTADLLTAIGVRNVHVTGCQSAYHAGLVNGPEGFGTAPDLPAYVTLTSAVEEAPLLGLAVREGVDFIAQDDLFAENLSEDRVAVEDWLITNGAYYPAPLGLTRRVARRIRAMLRGASGQRLHANLPRLAPDYLQTLYADGALTPQDYAAYLRAHFRKFYDVESWLAHIRAHYGFGVGTRFHGNMAAAIAGRLALWVVHDMRTKELCAHLGLPSIPLSEIAGVASMEEYRARADLGGFLAGFRPRLEDFLDYLGRNGVGDRLNATTQAQIAAWRSAA